MAQIYKAMQKLEIFPVPGGMPGGQGSAILFPPGGTVLPSATIPLAARRSLPIRRDWDIDTLKENPKVGELRRGDVVYVLKRREAASGVSRALVALEAGGEPAGWVTASKEGTDFLRRKLPSSDSSEAATPAPTQAAKGSNTYGPTTPRGAAAVPVRVQLSPWGAHKLERVVAKTMLPLLADPDEEARVIGKLPKGGEAYVLESLEIAGVKLALITASAHTADPLGWVTVRKNGGKSLLSRLPYPSDTAKGKRPSGHSPQLPFYTSHCGPDAKCGRSCSPRSTHLCPSRSSSYPAVVADRVVRAPSLQI